jgi:hypothetical protein
LAKAICACSVETFCNPTAVPPGTLIRNTTHTGVPAVTVIGPVSASSPASSTPLQLLSRSTVCVQPALLLALKVTLPPLPGVKVWA